MRIESGGETHHFLQPVKDVQLAVIEARHEQMETVGTEIHGCDHVGGARGAGGTGKTHYPDYPLWRCDDKFQIAVQRSSNTSAQVSMASSSAR